MQDSLQLNKKIVDELKNEDYKKIRYCKKQEMQLESYAIAHL